MSKVKTSFYCQSCGAQSPKWIGKCPSCGTWNSYVEEIVSTAVQPNEWKSAEKKKGEKANKAQLIGDINPDNSPRIVLPDQELNRVLGGGLVPGSLVLLGGEPGIGKSTLLLQLAVQLKGQRVLYISGEESEQQIRLQVEQVEPGLLIIDSIQTLYSSSYESAPGTVTQIRGCAGELLRFAKETSTPVILVGHITKDGNIAGPKVLEHMVDTVLQFEGDRHYIYRILRSVKNRFGSTAELGIYEMQGTGLKEVPNPSQVLLSQRDLTLSGTAVACTMEGLRPFLIETQALVSTAVYGTPQRSATGVDLRRLNMLLAVLEKRCGFRLAAKDVFLNIAGGIRVEDPATDLAVISAILSSAEDIPVDAHTCFAGEVGLTGEIRPVNRIDQRIREAARLGFNTIYISRYNLQDEIIKAEKEINVVKVSKVEEVFQGLFG